MAAPSPAAHAAPHPARLPQASGHAEQGVAVPAPSLTSTSQDRVGRARDSPSPHRTPPDAAARLVPNAPIWQRVACPDWPLSKYDRTCIDAEQVETWMHLHRAVRSFRID